VFDFVLPFVYSEDRDAIGNGCSVPRHNGLKFAASAGKYYYYYCYYHRTYYQQGSGSIDISMLCA
jgi:hypothetical protein